MLNIKKIIKNPKQIEKLLQRKDPSICLEPLLKAYTHYCSSKMQLDEIYSFINHMSKIIGEKKRKQEDILSCITQMNEQKQTMHNLSTKVSCLEKEYLSLLFDLPNIPNENVKISMDPKENTCIKTWKEKSIFSFVPKNHLELGELLHLFDFSKGAKIAGSHWPVYTHHGAQLEWALINFMIDIHLKNGFTFVLVPHLVKEEIMHGSGQLPKFQSQLFHVKDKTHPLYLIPTAEVALNGLLYNEMLSEEELPKLFISYTPCFRKEAGSHGTEERGLVRSHQFNKVEMYAFTKPEESDAIFRRMTSSAEEILQKLELHYRLVELVTGEISYSANKTLDIEVWLPGQNRYYEVSSLSHCDNFQSRRSHIRYKKKPKNDSCFVHTLNGSGLATSRLLIALIENNQHHDGSVSIPEALRPYLRHLPDPALLQYKKSPSGRVQ